MLTMKNEITPREMAKLLISCLPADANMDPPTESADVCAKYEEVITDMLYWTPRLTVKILCEAVQISHNLEVGAAKRFADSICTAVTYCRQKVKSKSSGKKWNLLCEMFVCF